MNDSDFRPGAPGFVFWYLGAWGAPIFSSNSTLKKQKGRMEHPPFPNYLNWLRGAATPRNRHSLILPYRLKLIRHVAA